MHWQRNIVPKATSAVFGCPARQDDAVVRSAPSLMVMTSTAGATGRVHFEGGCYAKVINCRSRPSGDWAASTNSPPCWKMLLPTDRQTGLADGR